MAGWGLACFDGHRLVALDVGAGMSTCLVMAWGCYFSLVHGWVADVARAGRMCRAAAQIVVEENPGAVIVEVGA